VACEILQELADTIFVNYFKNGFFVEKAAFSVLANAWQHQFQQIEICGKKIVLFAVIICGTVCQCMSQVIFVGPIERSLIEVSCISA